MSFSDETDPALFRAHMLSMLEAGASDEELDRIDDWVHQCFKQGNVDCASECAEIAVELLRQRSRPWATAYALNTLVFIHAARGDAVMTRVALAQLVDHSIKFDTPQAGLSGIHNVLQRLAEPGPAEYKARAFFRQTIDLGGETQKLDPDLNQLGGTQTANRIVLTVGKLSVIDIFHTNKYAHDRATIS